MPFGPEPSAIERAFFGLLGAALWLAPALAGLLLYQIAAAAALNFAFRRRIRRLVDGRAEARPAAIRWLSHAYGLHLVEKIYNTHVLADAYAAAQAEKAPDSVLARLAHRLDAMPAEMCAASVRKEIDAERPAPFDSHPAVRERLALARRYPSAPRPEPSGPAIDLFRHWPALTAELDSHVHEHLAGWAIHNARAAGI